jgi:hypothetical protein
MRPRPARGFKSRPRGTDAMPMRIRLPRLSLLQTFGVVSLLVIMAMGATSEPSCSTASSASPFRTPSAWP